jgi:uncharacterized protein (TIGR00251 family)
VLRLHEDGSVELDLHAKPKSSRDAIGDIHGDRLEIRVKAPPIDGKANAAIVKLLAKTLGLRRADITFVTGHTGKRKTVRIEGRTPTEIEAALGITKPRATPTTALVLVAALGATAACENARELPITVILPADTSDFDAADNASMVLRPDGDTFTFSVDGLDFSLELEGEPTTQVQQLELYLARGDDLLGWGSTAPFATAGADVGLALFLGRPGLLSTWPDALDAPDPDLVAAPLLGRGMILLQADGDTFVFDQFSLTLGAGRRLPDTAALAPDDGGLFAAQDGTALRLTYEASPAAWRYDPGADAWTEASLATELTPRPGAAAIVDPTHARVYLVGGGGLTDVVSVDLIPDDADTLAVTAHPELALDRPRDGATALWLPRDDDPAASLLVVGGDALGPVATLAGTGVGVGVGSDLRWTGLACALETLDAESPAALCVGGSVDDQPTADALALSLPSNSQLDAERRESFLPAPLPAPLLVGDDFALYAQGEGRWFRIAREDASVTEPDSAPLRAAGGHFVPLANGATFLVGGVDQDGVALDRWQVFTPAVEP